MLAIDEESIAGESCYHAEDADQIPHIDEHMQIINGNEGKGGFGDRNKTMKLSMYLLGISCLLPWNFFIQAYQYWINKFQNMDMNIDNDTLSINGSMAETSIMASNISRTEFEIMFSSYVAIAKVPYVLFLLLNIFLISRFHAVARIKCPLITITLLFGTVLALFPIDTRNNLMVLFFYCVMTIVILINVLSGILQGSVIGVAACLPRKYMGYTVNGMAMGGVIASVVQIMSIMANTSITVSALIYFTSGFIVLIITFVNFQKSQKSEYYLHYMSRQYYTGEFQWRLTLDLCLKLMRRVWLYAFCITVTYWITLSVLPAVLVLVASTVTDVNPWRDKLFVPVMFAIYSICDLFGRLIADIRCKFGMLLLTLSRGVFTPLFMLCNAMPRSNLPVVFDDVALCTFIVIFALSNGYLTAVILTQTPKLVDERFRELTGTNMAFFAGLGFLLGSFTSYILVKIL